MPLTDRNLYLVCFNDGKNIVLFIQSNSVKFKFTSVTDELVLLNLFFGSFIFFIEFKFLFEVK